MSFYCGEVNSPCKKPVALNFIKTAQAVINFSIFNCSGIARFPAFYVHNLLIALDQLFNAICGGWADETLSSRAWRLSQRGFALPRAIIEIIFFWERDHCYNAYLSERSGLWLPPELRKKQKES